MAESICTFGTELTVVAYVDRGTGQYSGVEVQESVAAQTNVFSVVAMERWRQFQALEAVPEQVGEVYGVSSLVEPQGGGEGMARIIEFWIEGEEGSPASIFSFSVENMEIPRHVRQPGGSLFLADSCLILQKGHIGIVCGERCRYSRACKRNTIA